MRHQIVVLVYFARRYTELRATRVAFWLYYSRRRVVVLTDEVRAPGDRGIGGCDLNMHACEGNEMNE